MSQAKNKRTFNNGNKQPRHTGSKVKVTDLRGKDAHRDTLVELTIEALKRFYKTVDALRLGNYKTGFNTYQHGLLIVEGYTFHSVAEGGSGFKKVTGTLFGLMKAERFAKFSTGNNEPGLGEFEQALFIEDEGGIAVDGNDTKITVTKFLASGDTKKFVAPYRSIEQFSATMIEELFALDILPQFRKELSHVAAKQAERNSDEKRHDAKPAAKPAARPAREAAPRRPMKKTAEPLHASA
jgi:hypothetical protein